MSDARLKLKDPVRAVWAIANDREMVDSARVVLAALVLDTLRRPADPELIREFIAEMVDLWGGMSLEVMRAEYADVVAGREGETS